MLPRLFLDHFHATSLVASSDDELVGFLIGFHSASAPHRAYVHFVGVAPAVSGHRARAPPLRDVLRRRYTGRLYCSERDHVTGQ